jgi:hypothetical protein
MMFRSQDRREDSKWFFFEKKNQKTFLSLAPDVKRYGAELIEVFLVLFLQKKNCLLPYLTSIARWPGEP